MSEGRNERSFSRVAIAMKASVSSDAGDVSGEVCDISMNGLCMKVDRMLPKDTACKVRVILGEEEPLVIDAVGEVRRCDEHGMAISFTSVDVESFPHLKMLILYNSDQSEEVIKECALHLGILPLSK